MNSSESLEPTHNGRTALLNSLLAQARKRLIDTGTRNRLVHTNRRAKKPGTLAVLYGDTDALFTELVRNARALRFRSDPRLLGKLEADADQVEVDEDLAPPAGMILQTRTGEEALQRRLLKFYRDAKTLEEEQGINILYLAVGFLRWFEDENSEVLREAPLILIPVSLHRDARRSTFDLKAREEEIGTNLPLSERLREFGVSLPDILDDDQLVPSAYFDAVEEAISGKRRWSIDRTGTELGLFSFAKLLMFHDLAGDAWPTDSILNHPLLQKLMMDGFEPENPLYPDDTKIDEKFSPADLVHVVDADGSQTLAIETTRAGRNLVIQGPPGTGKSQTIANIIASAAHDGKTVLFVAEKMVALDVVHSRLMRAGLGAICLELHSRATNKRMLAEELERTLALPGTELDREKETARLRQIRDSLNAISKALHSPIASSQKTPFQVIGDLVHAHGQSLAPPTLQIPLLAEWDGKTYAHIEAVAKKLSDKAGATGGAANHPWRGVHNCDLEPPDLERLKFALLDAHQKLEATAKLCSDAATLLDWPSPTSYRTALLFADLLTQVSSAPLEKIALIRRLNSLTDEDVSCVLEIAEKGLVANRAMLQFGATFKTAALTANVADVRATLARSTSWISRLSPSYRKASAELASWLNAPLPKTTADRVRLSDMLSEIQAQCRALSESKIRGSALLEKLWNGHKTDFAGVISAGTWLKQSRDAGLGPILERALFLAQQGKTAPLLAERIRVDVAAQMNATQKILQTLAFDLAAGFASSKLEDVELQSLTQRLVEWSQSIDQYADWAELTDLDHQLHTAGASDLAKRIAEGRLLAPNVVSELRHARAEALWSRCLKAPELRQLKNENRSLLVEEFKQLDVAQRQGAAAAIRARHAANMPRGAFGEMAIIRGEIGRRRGHMPIRKLMQRAGRTIQSIKPVLMMSPISVAQYLTPGELSFDMIVIDEASQVRPEDALGVIARGAQIVVVGDRHQLPPTNFFSRLLDDDSDEDEPETTDQPLPLGGAAKATELESILTLCEARGVPSKMLRWHYRSRHPSLIEVSNVEFYKSNLFLPPAPVAERGLKGLVVRRIRGAYDRGGKRTNAIEAQAIVEAVASHAEVSPELTLGIVTFSTAQRDLVSDYLDERRRTDPVLDSFLNGGGEETFVKNLENVQGDERDVILVCVGYGPRQAGAPLDSMNFGPVSSEGGERRLNVLFTRARHRCEIFVSFDSGDIDLGRATGAGPRVFKRFLTYGESGILDQPIVANADYDSYFEEDVANVARSFGYHIDAQVGSAGFKIDLAARHPDAPGKYVLAIECDGATYHHSLWARERDRLRQDVLESMGWRFHRIWSTDWFYRREEEIKRLKTALENASASPAPEDSAYLAAEEKRDPAVPLRHELSDIVLPPILDIEAYEVADFRIPNANRIEPHTAPVSAMSDIVSKIVQFEGPIHSDEVARRVASLWGKDRTGSRISAAVDTALKFAGRSGAILEENEFWFTPAQRDDCPIRDRATAIASVQKAEMLPPLEIRAAVFQALKQNGSIGRDEITTAVTRMLGFQRTGPDLRGVVLAVVDELLDAGTILIDKGWLSRSREADVV